MRIPGLDGLRAVSIGLVVLSHAAFTSGFPLPWSRHYVTMGGVGVQIFFCISGFLITFLLATEKSRTGAISFTEFYKRRAFKILPPYVAYLLTLWILSEGGFVDVSKSSFVVSATFTVNIFPLWVNDYLRHAWSLSIEAQFYIFWPLLFVFLRHDKARLIFLGSMTVFAGIVAIALYLLQAELLFSAFLLRGFPIFTGCILGILYARNRALLADLFASRTASWCALAILLLLLASWSYEITGGRLFYPKLFLGPVLDAVGLAYLVGYAALKPQRGPISALLNSRAFVAVGRISYSLYIWQELFFSTQADAVGRLVGFWPLNIALVFLAGALSYFLLEKPSAALRKKIAGAAVV